MCDENETDIRGYFAAHAMQGMLSNHGLLSAVSNAAQAKLKDPIDLLALMAVQHADALIKALKPQQPTPSKPELVK